MKLSMKGVLAVPIALGVTSTCAQIILLRELFVVFTGSELTFSISLSIWLISVSIGALVSAHLVTNSNLSPTLLRSLIIALILPVVQALCIRFVKPVMVEFGEIPSPAKILMISWLGLALTGIGFGLLFVVSTCLLDLSGFRNPIGLAYGLESFGSGLMGIILSFLLLGRLNPITILSATALLSGTALLVCIRTSLPAMAVRKMIWVLMACLALTILGKKVDISTRSWQWRPVGVVSTIDSRYGNIVVSRREGMFDFYESGMLSFSAPDLFCAEETVHIPLLMHRSPECILIIGGSGTGIIKEIEKHKSVVAVDYVELDPVLLRTAEAYLPTDWFHSTRLKARPLYGDGRRYVSKTDQMYDVLIVNVGEPLNLSTSRYYTKEFFEKAKSILKPGGIIALRVATEGSYLGGYRARMVADLRLSLRDCFSQVVAIPGESIHLIASDDPGLTQMLEHLPEALVERGIDSRFITEALIRDRLMPLRRSNLDRVLASIPYPKISRDRHPIALTNTISLWSQQFKSGKLLTRVVNRLGLKQFLIGMLVLGMLVSLLLSPPSLAKKSSFSSSLLICNIGLTSLFSQALMLFCFQVVSGYVYTGIALIVACFMFGMGFGSVFGSTRNKPVHFRNIISFQGIVATMPAIVLGTFEITRRYGLSPDLLFSFSAFLIGASSGGAFRVGSTLMARNAKLVSHIGGHTYSLDLIGASLAGVLTGFVIIPKFGFYEATLLVSGYNLICLLTMVVLLRL